MARLSGGGAADEHVIGMLVLVLVLLLTLLGHARAKLALNFDKISDFVWARKFNKKCGLPSSC